MSWHIVKSLHNAYFVNEEERRLSLSAMPFGYAALRCSLQLHVASLCRLEVELVSVNLVGYVLAQCRQLLRGHLLERLAVLRNAHLNVACVEDP